MNIQSINSPNFQNKINKQFDLSDTIADRHLAKIPFQTETSSKSSKLNLTFLSFGGGHTVHHYHHNDNGRPSRGKKKEMSDGSRTLIAIIGSLIMLAGSYFIGKNISDRDEAMKDLKSTRKFKKQLNKCLEKGQNDAEFNSIKKVAKATEKILKRTVKSSTWGLALKVALVAGAALSVVGAIAASPILAAVGGGAILLSGCALLMKWGIERSDRANKSDAKIIKDELSIPNEVYEISPNQASAPSQEQFHEYNNNLYPEVN